MGIQNGPKGKRGFQRAKAWKPSDEPLSSADAICPACSFKYVAPVKLPCEHHVCLDCLGRLQALSNLECPLCRRRIGSWTRLNKDKETLIDRNFEQRIAEIQVDDEKEEPMVRDMVHAKPGEVKSDLLAVLASHEEDLEKQRKRREQEEEELSTPLITQLQEEETKKAAEAEEIRKKQEEEDFRLAEILANERRLREENEMELDGQLLEEARMAKEAEEQRKKQEEEDYLLAQQLDMENKAKSKPRDGEEVIFLSKSPDQTATTAKLGKRRQSTQAFKSTRISGSKSQKDIKKRLNDSPNFASPKPKKAKPSSSPAATVTSSNLNTSNLITSYFNSKPTSVTSALPMPTPECDAITSAEVRFSPQKNKRESSDENNKSKSQLITPGKQMKDVSLRSIGTPSRKSSAPAATSSPRTFTSETTEENLKDVLSSETSVDCLSSDFRKSKVDGWLAVSPPPRSSPQGGFFKQCSTPSEPVIRKTRLFRFLDDDDPECEIGRSESPDHTNDLELVDLDVFSPSPEHVVEQAAALKKIQQKKLREEQDKRLAILLEKKDSPSR